jgi:general secretion pathway protein G
MASRTRAGEWCLGGRHPGFTLIELLVVLAIVALLLTLSLPRYFQHLEAAKETVLRANLHETRSVIDKFYADRGVYPNNLQELVDKHYLRELPYDPIAESRTAWAIVPAENSVLGQVADIRSSAQGNALDGTPFGNL